MSLSRLSIQRPVAVAMLFLAIGLLGAISFRRLPVDLLPDVAYPKLVVYTAEPGAAPAEVERFLSEPVEQALSAVPGVQEVESISREGMSLVTVRFAWGTDMDFAALNVRERLDGIADQIPELAGRPAVLRLDPESEPVLSVSATGGFLPELKELAEGVFRRRLEQIDGVAQAVVVGGLEREIHVEVDPARLDALGLDLEDVTGAVEQANASAPGGTIRRGRYRYSLRLEGEIQRVQQLAAVPLGPRGEAGADSASGAGLTLGDVARVTDGFRERESIARHDRRESVGLLVFKDAGANTVSVAREVDGVLAELRAEHPGVRLEVAMSQAGFISGAIDSVVANLVQGAALAILVLLLFLRDVRYPVAIGLAIPISIVGAFLLLDAAGVSLNVMSLGGLALGVGMLVDNSIVVLENIFRHRQRGLPAEEAARVGAEEVQGAVTASTLTTIAVFAPILYIEGVAGELFGALSLAVAFSLLASLFVALTLLPALAARWGDGEKAPEPAGRLRTAIARLARPPLDLFDRGYGAFARGYDRLLRWALNHRGRVLGTALGVLGCGVLLALHLDRRLLPDVDQGQFSVSMELPRGTPLEETARLARRAEEVLLADPAVATVFSSVGRRRAAAGAEEESGLHTALLEVRLHEGAGTAPALERLRGRLHWLPPEAFAVSAGEATTIGKLLGGTGADLAVRVRGDDAERAMAYARRLQARLAALGTLANVRLGTELGQPEMRIEIDRERAASYGVDPARIASTIHGYMRGRVATEYVDFDRKVPVVVRLPKLERESLSTLQSLRIDGIPVRELVRVREASGPAEIRRQGQSRVIAVYADVVDGGLDGAVAAVGRAVREVPPPAGARVEVGGENEEMRRSFAALAFAFGLAVVLVFMILAAEFENLVHPFVILLSVPMGVVGAVLALWITGEGLNTVSLIGIVILAGIVDNDAVVKVDFINQMRRRGLPVREAVLAAGHARLRPILMTTLTTMLGLVPMAFATGRGAELRAPLAISIFGGLLSATALTLVVLPVIYELAEEARARLSTPFGRPRAPTPVQALAAESAPVPSLRD